jgi:putative ABC transport system ATP-binding protein
VTAQRHEEDATEAMVRIAGLSFRYRHGDFALRVAELEIGRARTIAFTGPSGSGKTTLLSLIAGIRTPEQGQVSVDGVRIDALDEPARRAFRVRRLGLVFQEFELIGHLSVIDNILLPYRIGAGLRLERPTTERAIELARLVGIEDKLRRCVGRLSQGEKQRVALCRALLTRPRLLLADEPTGSLDPTNKQLVLDLLLDSAREAGSTLVMVTHDGGLLDRFDRVVDFSVFHESAAADRPAPGRASA